MKHSLVYVIKKQKRVEALASSGGNVLAVLGHEVLDRRDSR